MEKQKGTGLEVAHACGGAARAREALAAAALGAGCCSRNPRDF
ncbi:hypothetical protein ERO13_D09G006500v2 [Gossypium hirsutum]|nr:hypothetical protein ERO13_D09G006500v2 [Gossypium hirsutum]